MFLKEKELLRELNEIVSKEEFFWCQKLREVWLKDGDKNTKFFHNSTKARREVNKISHIIYADGRSLDNLDQIVDKATSFFQNLLNDWDGSRLGSQQSLLGCIPKLVTDNQNKQLSKCFSEEEI